jgi:hypothetical protein
MIFSALAAVAIGWLLRNYWLAFMSGLAVSYASALFNWLVYADRPDLNDYQFRTILAGFLAGALGVVVAFLRTAFDEYRTESRAAQASRLDGTLIRSEYGPRLSATLQRRLKLVDAKAKRLSHDVSQLTFGLVDRWVNRESYRDAERK